MIVARASCEPLDKRLLICHFIPTKAEDFRPKHLAKFFDKHFVFNVFLQFRVIHILDYIMYVLCMLYLCARMYASLHVVSMCAHVCIYVCCIYVRACVHL